MLFGTRTLRPCKCVELLKLKTSEAKTPISKLYLWDCPLPALLGNHVAAAFADSNPADLKSELPLAC